MGNFLNTSLKEFFGQRSYFTEKTIKALEDKYFNREKLEKDPPKLPADVSIFFSPYTNAFVIWTNRTDIIMPYEGLPENERWEPALLELLNSGPNIIVLKNQKG